MRSALVLAVAVCSAHVQNGGQCWDADEDFALPGSGLAVDNLRAMQTAAAAESDAELRSTYCRNAFLDEVKGRHCRPRIEAFCTSRCAAPADNTECMSGNGRIPVSERCWKTAYAGFRGLAPACNLLTLRMSGGQVELVPADGGI